MGQWHTATSYNSADERICPAICFAVTGNAAVTECTSIGPVGSYPLSFVSYGYDLCESAVISARWGNNMPSDNTDSHKGAAIVNTNYYANDVDRKLKVRCAAW